MPNFNGTEAWIEVDGERLEEYKVEQLEDRENGHHIRSFIASESGKKFVVRAKDKMGLSNDSIQIQMRVKCDGHDMGYSAGFHGIVFDSGLQVANKKEKPFRFCSAVFTDNTNAQHNSKLGTIVVELKFVQTIGRRKGGRYFTQEEVAKVNAPITEAKNVSQRVELADTVESHHNPLYHKAERLPDQPIRVFHFEYCSKELLQARKIIKIQSPKGRASIKKRAISDVDAEEILGLIPEERREAVYRRLKAERRKKAIKTEIKAERDETKIPFDAEIIDLT